MMTNSANRPTPRQEQKAIQGQQNYLTADQQMIQTIRSLKDGQLRNYEIRQLVNEAKLLGISEGARIKNQPNSQVFGCC